VAGIASPASVRLVWVRPDDESEVASFRITASTGAVYTAVEAPVTLTSLPNGVPVSFRVAAVRVGGGVGPWSTPSNTVTPRPAAPTNTWARTEPLGHGRVEAAGVRLKDGTVLAIGGFATPSLDAPVRSAERYDPTLGRWAATGSLDLSRSAFTTTLLRDGRVLVTGGLTDNFGVRRSTRIYHPATGRWSKGPRLLTARAGHTATLLANGKVLVAGGYRPSAQSVVATRTAEVYDPKANRWTRTGSMKVGRYYHSATRLKHGKVLVASGTNTIIQSGLRSSEVYDPANGRWATAGRLQTVRTDDNFCCRHTVLLSSGKVLLAGSSAKNGGRGRGAELFDPVTRRWTATGSLRVARPDGLTVVRLPGKRVLALGGSDEFGSLKYAEVFSERTGRWTRVNDLRHDRQAPLAVPLADGAVLVAGGATRATARRSSEVFTPAWGTSGPS
jgi:hypothetical protein